jgi:hypothetical protein
MASEDDSQRDIEEDKYLTPYQRMLEDNRLAQRGLEAAVASSQSRNPLLEERELVEQAAVPATRTIAPPPRPNPLVQPPVPLSMMPINKQIAWQQLADKTAADRAALEKTVLATEVARTERELQDEERKQSIAMISEVPKLREAVAKGDLDQYLAIKADLVSRFPVGSGSLESQRAFKSFDDILARKVSVEDEVKKAKAAREGAFEQKRVEAGYKEAERLGADVVQRYAALIDKDPTAAAAELAKAQQEDVRTQLRATGMTPEEITQTYGGTPERPFQYAAAQAAQKVRAAQATEQQRATANFSVLDKMRRDSGFDPADAKQLDAQGRPKDPFTESEGWTPDMESAWQRQRDYLISVTPQIPANRAGVAGMETRPGALTGQSIYRDYKPLAAQPPPPSQALQRAPVNQEPVGTQKVINGVASVKYPDGKWYKIKQK